MTQGHLGMLRAGGALMLHYGRRKAIALDSLFYTAGPLLMALALHPSMLIAGRFLTGLGIGISAVVAPAYLGEIAPARMRGRVVESYEILLCLGMLASVLVDAALQHLSDNSWRWMVRSAASGCLPHAHASRSTRRCMQHAHQLQMLP